MPFSLGSYLLGVGTVVGAIAFALGGGALLTNTAMKETAATPTRVERVARTEPKPPAQQDTKENPAPPAEAAAAAHPIQLRRLRQRRRGLTREAKPKALSSRSRRSKKPKAPSNRSRRSKPNQPSRAKRQIKRYKEKPSKRRQQSARSIGRNTIRSTTPNRIQSKKPNHPLRPPGRGNRRQCNKTSPSGQVSCSVGKSRISTCFQTPVRLPSFVHTIGRLSIATIDGSAAGRIRQQIGTRPHGSNQPKHRDLSPFLSADRSRAQIRRNT